MKTLPRALLLRSAGTLGTILAAAAPAVAHPEILTPNGGEILNSGDTVEIRWVINLLEHTTLNWDLWYSTNGPSGPWVPIELDFPVTGSVAVGTMHTYDWVVPDAPSSTVRVRVRQDNVGQDYLDVSDANFTIDSSCTVPVSYCLTSPNSVGSGALMTYLGSLGIATNDFEIRVTNAVPGENGIFYYGPSTMQAPFGEGFRCVGGQVFRLNPPVTVGPAGNQRVLVDFTQPPAGSGPGTITPLSTWHFQFWYRDPAGGGSAFNLSDGLSVTFCP